MNYKYVIRKINIGDNAKYIPLIWNKENWKYLIMAEPTGGDKEIFMVSRKTRREYDNLIEAYRFIASHRMEKGSQGKDRPKCLYFKDTISMLPIIGLFYTIPKLIGKVPLKFLFTNPLTLSIATGVQVISLILISLFPLLV